MNFVKRLFCRHKYIPKWDEYEDANEIGDYGYTAVRYYYKKFQCKKCGNIKREFISKEVL